MRSFTQYPAIVLVTAVLSICLIWWYPSTRDFSLNNPSWNGLTQFAQDYHATVVPPAALRESGPSESLILIPRRVITAEELQQVTEFVRRGGTLVLLDDFGFGNQVAEGLGLQPRFSGKRLLDPLINQKNQHLPKATFLPSGAQSRVFFSLNQPSSIDGVAPERALATSSPFSYLDENRNDRIDLKEPTGPFTVATEILLGQGKVVLISDPSILINAALDQNRKFLDALFQNKRIEILAETVPETILDKAQNALYLLQGVVMNPIGALCALIVLAGLPLTLGRRFQGD